MHKNILVFFFSKLSYVYIYKCLEQRRLCTIRVYAYHTLKTTKWSFHTKHVKMAKCGGRMVVHAWSACLCVHSLNFNWVRICSLIFLGHSFSWMTEGMIVHKRHMTVYGSCLTKIKIGARPNLFHFSQFHNQIVED